MRKSIKNGELLRLCNDEYHGHQLRRNRIYDSAIVCKCEEYEEQIFQLHKDHKEVIEKWRCEVKRLRSFLILMNLCPDCEQSVTNCRCDK
jgi:hypothetical protein